MRTTDLTSDGPGRSLRPADSAPWWATAFFDGKSQSQTKNDVVQLEGLPMTLERQSRRECFGLPDGEDVIVDGGAK